jgi:hypothetical protein
MMRWTVKNVRRWILGSIASLCTLSTAAGAQDPAVVRGRVLDAESMRPIHGASVSPLASDRGTLTDSLGRFSLKVEFTSEFILRVEHLGYDVLEWRVSGADPGPFELLLSPDPLQLEALTVLSERFAERQRGPFGVAALVDREQLLHAPDGSAYDLIRRLLPFTQPCDIYSEALCLGRDEVSVCLDDLRVPSRLLETVLLGVDPRKLYRIEIYSRVGEVRLFTHAYMQRLVRTGGSLRPLTFGCRND